jgi:hypothetical protein
MSNSSSAACKDANAALAAGTDRDAECLSHRIPRAISAEEEAAVTQVPLRSNSAGRSN